MRLITSIAFVVVTAAAALAQSIPAPPGPNAPRFEVASVKRNLTGDRGPRRAEPDRFVSIGWPLRSVIATAYRARGIQVVGGPAWLDTDLFDINAKAPDNTPPAEILGMVRALLAERFKLRARVEQREMPVYALVVARTDGRLGPGMRRTTEDCARVRAEGKAAPGLPQGFPVCSSRLQAQPLNGTMTLVMAEGGITVPSFIANVAGYVDRIIIDRTGLTGNFDLRLQFELPGSGPAATAPNPGGVTIDSAPTLVDAVQQQLGLKLQSERAQIDVLVIDNVEPPSPD